MGITVVTIYFLTLAVVLLARIVHSFGGVLVVLVLAMVGGAVIAAAGHLTGRR